MSPSSWTTVWILTDPWAIEIQEWLSQTEWGSSYGGINAGSVKISRVQDPE